MDRPTPFELVFSGLAPERFPALRDALAAATIDPLDRDALLLTLPAMNLLRDLRPEGAESGEGIGELTALLHHAYLAWAGGLRTWAIEASPLRRLLAPGQLPTAGPPGAGYIQLPERLVWASLTASGPWEPLDGCFVHPTTDGALRALGVFGVHPSRDGFTVAEATGRPGLVTARHDGAPFFAPSLDGGERAGLHAVVESGELVELAGRTLAALAAEPTPAEDG